MGDLVDNALRVERWLYEQEKTALELRSEGQKSGVASLLDIQAGGTNSTWSLGFKLIDKNLKKRHQAATVHEVMFTVPSLLAHDTIIEAFKEMVRWMIKHEREYGFIIPDEMRRLV